MVPVRWGVLSTAAIAVDHVIPAMQAVPGCVVSAIASRHAPRAEAVARQLQIPRAYGGYEALLDDPEVDCVYLAMPNSEHVSWALQAVAAGKAVLCEKPMAANAEDAARTVAAARQAGVLVAEGFMYRYHDQFRWCLDLVGQGRLGRVRRVRGSIGFEIGGPPNIRLRPELGGGALLDVGCYPLDAMCHIYGAAPLTAQAVRDHDGGIDRDCAAVLTFPGGGIGVMDATFRLPWLQAPLEVHGEQGVLRLHNAYNPGTSPCTATLTWRGAKDEVIEFAGMNMYRAMVQSFSESYRTGAPLAYPPEASLATATAITLVRMSSEKYADA